MRGVRVHDNCSQGEVVANILYGNNTENSTAGGDLIDESSYATINWTSSNGDPKLDSYKRLLSTSPWLDPEDTNEDPLLVDENGNSFVADDIDGEPRDTRPDYGADEG